MTPFRNAGSGAAFLRATKVINDHYPPRPESCRRSCGRRRAECNGLRRCGFSPNLW